jgi:hypothetical protein
VNFTGDDADGRLHSCRVDFDAEDPEQVADTSLGAVAVQTLEAADGPVVVGLEVGGSAINRAGVFIDPRTSQVVLAVA